MANPITQIIISAVDKTKAAFTSAKGGLSSIGESAGNLKALLGSVFTGLSVAGFIGQIKAVANEMDNAVKAAKAAGTSVEKFSGLSYASGQSGGGPEVLQKSLIKLSGSLEDSDDSASAAADTWRKLKLDPKQFDDSADALLAIADRFKAMPDGIAKTNLSVDLFGEKIGPKMIPLLNEGADGIKRLTDEARVLGKVLDDETGAAAERLNDTLDRLNARKSSLFAKALPSLEQYVSALDEIISRGTTLDQVKFFTTGYISEDVLNRITDAGERVQDYNAEIFKLQQQLLELRRVEGEGSPNVKIWEQRIAALEQTRATLAKKVNEDSLKDSKKTNDDLGKGYEDDAKNFKKANEEKISDAKRLQTALQAAFTASLKAEEDYRKDVKALREKAENLTASSGDKSQDSIRADATLATMKLERLKANGSPDEIRDQAEAVKDLASNLDDAEYKTWLMQRAMLAEASAAEKSAEAEAVRSKGLAEQMDANEIRMAQAKKDAEDIGKPVSVDVSASPQTDATLAKLKEIKSLVDVLKDTPVSLNVSAPGGNQFSGLLGKAALQYGRR